LYLSHGNTYTGTTAINDGMVYVYDPTAFGASTSAIELNGRAGGPNTSVAGFGNDIAGLALNLTRPLVVRNGNAVVNGLGARSVLLLSGPVSGDGGLYFEGNYRDAAGITFLVGSNTYAGGTTLAGTQPSVPYTTGNLAWATDANLGAPAGPLNLGTDGTTGVVLMGNWTTTRAVNFQGFGSAVGAKFDTNGFDATLGGRLTGTPAYGFSSVLVKAGPGTLTLANVGASNMTPALAVHGGTVVLTGDTRLPAASEFVLRSGTLRLDNTGTAVSDRLNAGAVLRVQAGGAGTLRIDAGGGAVNQDFRGLLLRATAHGRIVLTAGAGGSARLRLTDPFTGYDLLSARGSALFVAGDGLVNTSTAAAMGQTGMVFAVAPTAGSGQMSGSGPVGTPTVGILRGGYGARTTGGTSPVYGLLTQTST
ncbi:MAG: hypothetical protein LC708_03480, partial [Actinobacteria bacterium]|nr:hypothetical protein [Actinomycetota bacterium]